MDTVARCLFLANNANAAKLRQTLMVRVMISEI